jgi:hypothetical protein
MERAVMRRSGPGVLSRIAQLANARGRQRQTDGPRSQPLPVQLQLRELRGRPRFDPYRRGQRRGHAGLRARRKAGLAGEQQQERQADTRGERPRETGPPTHQDELIRISRGLLRRVRGQSLNTSTTPIRRSPQRFRVAMLAATLCDVPCKAM